MSKRKTKNSKTGSPVGQIITIISLAIFALLLGLGSNQEYYRMQRIGIMANAQIVSTYPVPRIGIGYTICFYTEDNQEVVANINNLKENKVGDMVQIIYDPNDTQSVISADTKPKGWVGTLMSGILLLIGLLALVAYLLDARSAKTPQ